MVRLFLKRFLLLCLIAFPVGLFPLLFLGGWKSAAAFALSFLLIGLDFLWLGYSIGRIVGSKRIEKGVAAGLALTFLLKMVLLLGGLYGILWLLPGESLGVILGMGGPLIMLSIAGTLPAKG